MKNVFLSLRRRRAALASRRRRVQKRCGMESLEGRLLMASDLSTGDSATDRPIYQLLASAAGTLAGSTFSSRSSAASSSAIPSLAEGEAEGEPAPDLVAFAKALSAAGVKFFGADWCPFCTEQKLLFEDGKNYLPFFEVTNPDRTLNALGQAEGITKFPTWKFPNGQVVSEVLTLQQLSTLSGVPIPTSETPSFVPLPSNIEVKAGSPLHLAIDAYDPNGGPLTITATSTNSSIVSATVPTGNRSLKIDVEGYGPMVFQLFEDKAPVPAGRVIQLAQSGFYNQTSSNSIKFHRVIDNFVIQSGDPTGTGGGGSSLGDFDDQFHPDLQHNRTGVLSFAKGGDDTNDSQFFITEGPQRNLDFNHSVFGQLIEGDAVREGISRVPVNADNQPQTADDHRPTRDVKIKSVSVFQDEENGLVMLKAPHGVTGTSQVQITVTDAQGHSSTQTVTVNVVPDNSNSGPILNPVPEVKTTVNTPVTFQLSATDIENNPNFFDAVVAGSTTFNFTVNNDTGSVTVTPPNGFVGKLQLLVGVRGAAETDSVDDFDRQTINITVAPTAPTGVDLLDASDTGTSNTDNITSSKQVQVQISGVTTSAFVTLLAGNTVVGQGSANGNTIVINADLSSLGDGQHTLRATQRINNETSEPSTGLNITVDSTTPTFTSTPPTSASVGQAFTYDVQTSDEATSSVAYSLVGAPSGITINPSTGTLSWTPTAGQIGAQTFTIEARDPAGNVRQQVLNVNVAGTELVRFRLETTKLDGTAAGTFNVNEEFFLNIYVSDRRAAAQGVLSAYLDVLFPGQLIDVVGTPEFGNHFLNNREVDVAADGVINEAGAAASNENSGSTEFLLLKARLKGVASGQGTIQAESADQTPQHDVRLIGQDGAVPANQVNYGSAAVAIVTPFTAVNDVFNVDEDGSGTLDVRANDTFPTGQVSALRISGVGATSNGGQVSVTEDGRISYEPAENFAGTETFTYTITDDVNGTATGTVTVQVQPLNDPPTATNDQFTGNQAVNEDSSNNTLNLLSNDSFAPDSGETLRITNVGTRSNGGSVTIAPNGTHVIYTPAANFNGQETFTYTISDGNGGTATATVTVEVKNVNDPPVANPDTFTLAEDTAQASYDVLANDTTGLDPNETLTVTTVAPINNAQGTLIIASDGKSVRYTPKANFAGQEVFRYVISDGNGGTAESRVTFTVTGVNDPPTANDDTGTTGRFTAVKNATAAINLDVLKNDSAAPDTGETLTITAVGTGSQGGTITISADKKTILYTPKANFEGNETFTYTISDGNGGTDTATAEVIVRAYIPSVLSGSVFMDNDKDGTLDSGELPIAGVEITLQGTDDFGAPVQKSITTGANGSYTFTDLAPGNYTITQAQPAFLQNGVTRVGSQGGTASSNRLTIDLAENTQGTANNFGEQGRGAGFYSLRDLFASTARNSLLLIVNTATNKTTAVGAGNWQQYHDVSAKLSANQQTWELTVQNGQQVTMKTTLPNRPSKQLEILGQSGSNMLVRVFGGPNALNFQPVTTSQSSGSGEGEGEGAEDDAALAATSAMAASQAPADPAAADQVLADQEAADWNGAVDESLLTNLAQPPARRDRVVNALEQLFASQP